MSKKPQTASYASGHASIFDDSRIRHHFIMMLIDVAFCIASIIVGGLIRNRYASTLIIRMHYSGFRVLGLALGILSSCGGVMSGAHLFFFGKHLARFMRERDSEVSQAQQASQLAKKRSSKATALETPESIYDYIKKIYNDDKDCYIRQDASDILKQLDTMNQYQAQLEELFRVNGITNLGDARDLLQDIEDALCMISTKRLINYYIIGSVRAFSEHVAKTLDDNYKLLEQAEGTLKDIVEFINGDKSFDEVTAHIAAFRKTIQNFIKEENENETQFEKDFGHITLPHGDI